MTPVPILFLDHAAALGGAEFSLLAILRGLDRGRWDPQLAAAPGPLAEQARAADVSVHEIDFPRLRRFPPAAAAAARRIVRLVRRTGAELIYANTVRTAFYGAAAAKLSGRPLVWHMRDAWLSADRPRHPGLDARLKSLLGRAATRVIANSRYTASRLGASEASVEAVAALETAGAGPSSTQRPDKVTVIYNGIETARFDPVLGGTVFRDHWGIPSDAPLVGTVGRLVPSKGQHRFIEAMAGVAAACPQGHFLIVGGAIFGDAIFGEDGSYEESLHRLAVRHGLEDRLTFTGHLGDVAPALAAMDVFVQPGDPEGFGRVNLEAMAMAKPVVALAHGAVPEIVIHGETGILVPPEAPEGLADAVTGLLQSPERLQSLGAAGRERVSEHFSVSRMIERIDRLLGDVLR
jgi:glycosyltransferase involved in cell wall biosynthesis